MKIRKEGNQIIITPEEGMWLTNGNTYGKEATLPEKADVNDWCEITEEEHTERTKDVEEGEE